MLDIAWYHQKEIWQPSSLFKGSNVFNFEHRMLPSGGDLTPLLRCNSHSKIKGMEASTKLTNHNVFKKPSSNHSGEGAAEKTVEHQPSNTSAGTSGKTQAQQLAPNTCKPRTKKYQH